MTEKVKVPNAVKVARDGDVPYGVVISDEEVPLTGTIVSRQRHVQNDRSLASGVLLMFSLHQDCCAVL